jgi:hypothetical protein
MATAETKPFEITTEVENGPNGGFFIKLVRGENPLTLKIFCGSLRSETLKPDLSKVENVAQKSTSYDFRFTDNDTVLNGALDELKSIHLEKRRQQQQQQQQQQQLLLQQQQKTQKTQQLIADETRKMKILHIKTVAMPDNELTIALFSTEEQDATPINFDAFSKTQTILADSIRLKIDGLNLSAEEKNARKTKVSELLNSILKTQKKLMQETYVVVNGYNKLPPEITPDIRLNIGTANSYYYPVKDIKTYTREMLQTIKTKIDSMQTLANQETVFTIPSKAECSMLSGWDYERQYGTLEGWNPCPKQEQPFVDVRDLR